MIRTWTPESDTPKPPGAGTDYRTVKAWFQQCRDLAAAVEAQKNKIRRIQDIAGKITPSLSGMPGGGGAGDKTGLGAARIIDEQRTLQQMETDLCNLRIEAARRAYAITDGPGQAESICEYYINGKTQEQIAKETGVSDGGTVRWRIHSGFVALAEIWDDFA